MKRSEIGVITIGDFVAGIVFRAMALAVSGVFAWIVISIAAGGISSISWDFLLSEPEANGRRGGISTVLVSTTWILSICLAVSVPLGFAAAVLLSEFSDASRFSGRFVRRSLDVLAGVPSIVFGLFGSVFFCRVLGMGFSLLAGGLTLACMVLPIVIRSGEAALRSVPAEYRMASAALGISRRTSVLRLLLPAAAPGLIAGLILGLGRAAAETAALLFTSGYVDRMPESVFDSGRTLTVHIYDLAMNVPGGNANAYGSALVLIVLLLAINGVAAWIGEHGVKRRLLRS